jgi:catechol 2,3-dioxygenase
VERIGLRVLTEDDLDRAAAWFAAHGRPTKFIEVEHQGRTLHTADSAGVPLEFCATMTDLPTLLQEFHLYKGGSPLRLDHFQIAVPDVQSVTDFYAEFGFRLSEYTATDGSDELWGAWLERKGNPHDLVFSNGRGPRLHHFAFVVPETRDLVHACDVASSMGFGDRMERGPGRHGIGNALFVYFRDPDGYRVELFNAHYQIIDINHPPLRWDLSNTRRSQLWGLPATNKWFFEASPFAGVPVAEPGLKTDPVTLERFLASQ